MSVPWTEQQILALAPDSGSASSGKGLASASKWQNLGQNSASLWGECQGSGSKPYQVKIDLSEPAFSCSCPSRKFPCKHGIGLFLIFAKDAASLKEGTPPAWVTEWLEKRQATAQKKEEARRPDSEKTPEELAKAAAEQAKRAAAREKKVAQGLGDLDLWMRDLVRQGFASLPSRPLKFWDETAARMVDAQAPGAARLLREMAGIPSTGDGWQERLLERLGLLYLLLEGYKRLTELPEAQQADIRTTLGFPIKQEEVLALPGVADRWQVQGQRTYDEDQFKVHRTWLWGERTGRTALILNFSRANMPRETVFATQTVFEGELAFFPGAAPLRALPKSRQDALYLREPHGFPTHAAMLSAYADTLAGNPWTEVFPAMLQNVLPRRQGKNWVLEDREGRALPIQPGFGSNWTITSLSGGRPLAAVFAEWDGSHLLPLTTWGEEGCVILPSGE